MFLSIIIIHFIIQVIIQVIIGIIIKKITKFSVRIIHIIIVIIVLIIMIDQGVDCDPEIYEGDVRCYTMASQYPVVMNEDCDNYNDDWEI